jgi:hypothetical protein
MGLRMFSPADGICWLTLECDGANCGKSATFQQYGYIAQRKAANAAGWKWSGAGKVFGSVLP